MSISFKISFIERKGGGGATTTTFFNPHAFRN